jgi:4-amino-4-deoxy-L-arabinose transferase-like glycosyltransferase
MFDTPDIKTLLGRIYPLLAILIGVLIVSLPMGPYQTLDTQLEYNTTRGVLRWGYPYLDRFGSPSIDSYGDLFNMPPLGFYTQALHFTIFGTNLENGIMLITLFGLGCTILVYLLAQEFYGKTTGLFAAAFFALAPWELIMTRAFLIDTQCLFLSLAYLYVGILSIRKDSLKLAGISGILFAAALLTKQFAVFMLIPLAILYIYYSRPKNKKILLSQLAVFVVPVVLSNFLWYNIILGKELLYLLNHNDFRDYNFPNYTPTYTFVSDFLINYGLGLFFCATVVVSLVTALLFWRRLPKKLVLFDVICLVTLSFIVGLVLYLAIDLNLKAPYTSAVKYLYHTLPLFSIAAASIVAKVALLLKNNNQASKPRHIMITIAVIVGIVLLVAPLITHMLNAQQLTTTSYLIFRVQPKLDVGYSFYVQNPPTAGDPALTLQFVGFIIVLSGLAWNSRHFIAEQTNLLHNRLKTKNCDTLKKPVKHA